MEEKTNEIVRYSDADLAEFKAIVEKKLQKAKEELEYLQEQILEISENSSDEHGGDWMDDSNVHNDIEFLNNMAIRQRKYIQDLENALVRIHNKTYGICVVTGKLIDKRRLLAVPTANKSVEAKANLANPPGKKQKEELDEALKLERKKKLSKAKTEPKIITKVIKKPTKAAPKPVEIDDEDDDDLVIEDGDIALEEELEISSTEEELEDAAGSEEPQVFDNDDDNDDI